MIPQELKKHPFWCVRKNKIPYNPQTGQKAKPNQAATFGTYKEACAVVDQYDGLGVLVKDGLSAVDIDNCYDGKLSPLAAEVIDYFGSYAEYSPSGKGIRIIFRSPNPITYDKGRYYTKNSKQGLELYLSGIDTRYVTVTGDTLNGFETVRTLTEREILNFAEKHMKRPEKAAEKPAPAPVGLSTKEILDKASRARNGQSFDALFGGQWEGRYQSHSEADQAFCNMLAFWCGRDTEQMDTIFRASGLYRHKWERDDYRTDTINKAINDCNETYSEWCYRHRNDEPIGAVEKDQDEKKSLKLVPLSDVEYKPPEFLIDPYIPLGVITILQGDPGVGKTALMCKIAAEVSKGGSIIDTPCQQGKILLLSLEDGGEVLRGRLDASKGDASQCFCLDKDSEGFCAENLSFESEEVEDAIRAGGYKLVVFDPYQAFFSEEKDMNRANVVRHVMTKLSRIAKKYNCAVVIIAHMSKGSAGGKAIYRALGSLDLAAAARSILYAGRSPEDPNLCVVAHIKSSHAKKGSSFAYTIGERGGVEWQGYSHLQAEDLERMAMRQEKGIDYEMEPLVQVVRQLMTENPNGLFIGYEDFLNYALGVLESRPCRDGKELRKALGELATEMMKQDKIKVEFARKRVKPFVRFGEMYVPEFSNPVKGMEFSNYTPPGFGQPSLLGGMTDSVSDD